MNGYGVGEDLYFTIARRERPAWFTGTLIGIALALTLGWFQQRDDAARIEDAGQHTHRLDRLLAGRQYYDADAACLGAASQRADLVFFAARSSDGNPPKFTCVHSNTP